VDVTCPNPICAQTFAWTSNVNLCPWCLTEIKKPPIPKKHYVQYHKTDEYGPPECRPGDFTIHTSKSVDGLHGCTIWLISGEGSPKKYFIGCYFVVDETGDHPSDKPGFKHWASGKQGQKLRPPIPLDGFPWFHDLRASLFEFGAGLSDIQPKTSAKLERLVAEQEVG
jgi:hypothetical protein